MFFLIFDCCSWSHEYLMFSEALLYIYIFLPFMFLYLLTSSIQFHIWMFDKTVLFTAAGLTHILMMEPESDGWALQADTLRRFLPFKAASCCLYHGVLHSLIRAGGLHKLPEIRAQYELNAFITSWYERNRTWSLFIVHLPSLSTAETELLCVWRLNIAVQCVL